MRQFYSQNASKENNSPIHRQVIPGEEEIKFGDNDNMDPDDDGGEYDNNPNRKSQSVDSIQLIAEQVDVRQKQKDIKQGGTIKTIGKLKQKQLEVERQKSMDKMKMNKVVKTKKNHWEKMIEQNNNNNNSEISSSSAAFRQPRTARYETIYAINDRNSSNDTDDNNDNINNDKNEIKEGRNEIENEYGNEIEHDDEQDEETDNNDDNDIGNYDDRTMVIHGDDLKQLNDNKRLNSLMF